MKSMKKLLIVVDMQKDFVDGALGSKEAVAIVDNVVNKINTFDGDIIVTYDTHRENYMETREGKKRPVPHCIKGTDGWELDKKVQSALDGKDYITIEKPTFGSLELVEICEEEQYEQVELVGLVSNICVLSNAVLVKTALPEAEVIVDASCTACADPVMNEKALDIMEGLQITVINR